MRVTEKKTDEGNEACKGKKKAKGPADMLYKAGWIL